MFIDFPFCMESPRAAARTFLTVLASPLIVQEIHIMDGVLLGRKRTNNVNPFHLIVRRHDWVLCSYCPQTMIKALKQSYNETTTQSLTGWFQPLWKILVKWDDSSQ